MAFLSPNSKLYPILYFICGLLEVLLVSGITYGWAAIVPVFKKEQFYEILCDNNEDRQQNSTLSLLSRNGSNNGNGGHSQSLSRGCAAQRERLNLVFNIAVFSLCGFTLPIGMFVDKYGPRASRIVGCILYTAAIIGFAFITKELSNLLFPVFIVICAGGGFLAMSVYQISNVIFTNVKSLVLCILHGAFDSSAIVLLVFKVLYDEGFHLKYIAFTYIGICVVLIIFMSIFLIPPYSVLKTWNKGVAAPVRGSLLNLHYIGTKLADYNPNFLEGNEISSAEDQLVSARMSILFNKSNAEDEVQIIDEEPVLNGDVRNEEPMASVLSVPDTVSGCVCSSIYLLELLYLSIIQLRLWYFIGSLDGYLHVMTGNNKKQTDEYINIFGYVQFLGVAFAPIIGLIFDRKMIGSGNTKQQLLKKKSADEQRLDRLKESILPFSLTNLLCIAFSVLTLTPWLGTLVPTFILQVVVRGFLYADHAAFIGIAFKPELFGTLYGLGIFLSGIIGLLQFVLFVLAEKFLGGNPFWVNIGLLALVCLANIHPIYLWYYCRKMKRTRRGRREIVNAVQ